MQAARTPRTSFSRALFRIAGLGLFAWLTNCDSSAGPPDARTPPTQSASTTFTATGTTTQSEGANTQAATSTKTVSATKTASATASASGSPTATDTGTGSASATRTETGSATGDASATKTATGSTTAVPRDAGSDASAPSATSTGSATASASASKTATSISATSGHFQMEDLDRGVVAVKVSGGIYVGWRMLGYEYDATASNVAYNLYRDGTKIANVTDSTNYLDASGTTSSKYTVSVVIKGGEYAPSKAATAWAQNYLRIPLKVPAASSTGATYSPNDGSPGDLDGDGQYEIVLKWDPSDSKDNSQSGDTSNVYLDGLKLDGTLMWRIDLGPNIRAGAHYTQFVVYDFDGDGQAEVACKTAPGTKDGTGARLHTGPAATDDQTATYANSKGYILSGPEYLTVFNGKTGAEIATVAYPVARGTVSSWGDSYGNRVDRFNGGAAFVSDSGSGLTASGRPSIIMQRGYYTRLTMSALNFRDGKLSKLWTFDSNGSGNSSAAGQGDHSAMAIDADGDGAQEIVTGSATVRSNGTLMCTTGLGHGDALHVGELVLGKAPAVFTVLEDKGGYDVHDAATCKSYVKVTGGDDNGRGVADYIEPALTKAAGFWSGNYAALYSCVDGSTVESAKPRPYNFLIYWDGDESRELQDGAIVYKYAKGSSTTLLDASGCTGNNSTKNTPTLTADLLGDWREEMVVRESGNAGLRIYTTTDITKRRIYTLMHDPTYRMQVSFEQSSYNQPPHVGFHIGAGMANPPVPNIRVK